MVDADGYRPNVGIILMNEDGQLLWARRIGQNTWQFPQGGIKKGETSDQALFRELKEEVGLEPDQVEILSRTKGWLRYRLPKRMVRHNSAPLCIGQKQKWYLLSLRCDDFNICLDCADKPEFDDWRWVSYWYPLNQVISFKKDVYRRALKELITSAHKRMTKHTNS